MTEQSITQPTVSERIMTAEELEQASAATRTAEQERDARIQELERQLATLMSKNQEEELSEEERLARVAHPYEHPHDYSHVLVLATGELVGHPNAQSTHHYSRTLQREVPVRDVIEHRGVES